MDYRIVIPRLTAQATPSTLIAKVIVNSTDSPIEDKPKNTFGSNEDNGYINFAVKFIYIKLCFGENDIKNV